MCREDERTAEVLSFSPESGRSAFHQFQTFSASGEMAELAMRVILAAESGAQAWITRTGGPVTCSFSRDQYGTEKGGKAV